MGTRRSESGTDFLIFPASKGEDERPLRVFSMGAIGEGPRARRPDPIFGKSQALGARNPLFQPEIG
ncbi:hypothetical protein AGR7C_Cc140027 [Agrobacterium deltaense Zutra 3/1]|uniref:Uncharacterized protein n=1 Tax=Agrobacterium deltaense Zutra 3/1 TaxID=1183427 RepID=A0A1S7PCB3_9HYPH|nr:hypothetical protein AGR7C_Cc140027 [Agrobacterium deltaense Zutra 3/1]